MLKSYNLQILRIYNGFYKEGRQQQWKEMQKFKIQNGTGSKSKDNLKWVIKLTVAKEHSGGEVLDLNIR